MATLAHRGSGTPTEGVASGTAHFTALTNAVDGAPGTNPATYATWSTNISAASAYIQISGYDFSTIADTDTLNSVTLNLRHTENNITRIAEVKLEAYSGSTSLGTPLICTRSTTARNDSATFPVTLAQLKAADFSCRVTVTRAVNTSPAVASVDHVDVTADYTPLPVGVALAGQSDGAATASGTFGRIRALAGQSDGAATASATLTVTSPAVTQAAYRFYADGTENASAPLAAQDTAYSVGFGSGDINLQLRARLQSTVAAPATTDDWQLQWEKNANGTWLSVGAGSVLLDSYDESNGDQDFPLGDPVAGFIKIGQSFLGDGKLLTRAGFYLSRAGNPVANITAALYAHSGTFGSGVATGTALVASTTVVAASTLPVSPTRAWVEFDFPSTFTLTNGTPYVITVEASGLDSSNFIIARMDSSGTHAGNAATYDTAWYVFGSYETIFKVYTGSPVAAYDAPSLTDGSVTTNRLGAGTGGFVAGKISETGFVNDLGWTANSYTELVYSLTLLAANVANGDTLRFRVLRNGATTGMTYTQTPTISIVTAHVPGPVALAGQSDGTSTSTAALGVNKALAGSADGISTATAALARAQPLAGQTDGVATVSATLARTRGLAGQADGASTTGAAVAPSALLSEPFNDFTTNGWTLAGNPTPTIIVGGRTGNGAYVEDAAITSTPTATYTVPSVSESADIVFGTAWKIDGYASDPHIVEFRSDAASTLHCSVTARSDGSLGFLSGTLLGWSAPGLIALNTWYYVEARVHLADSPNGTWEIRLNGVSVASGTGDTKQGGTKTVFDSIRLTTTMFATHNATYDDLYIDTGATATFHGDPTASALTGTPLAVARALSGRLDGVATTTATVVVAKTLAGRADGIASATSALSVVKSLAGQTDGVSTATGTLSITRAIAGRADGVSTTAAALLVGKALAGRADGVATVTAAAVVARALAAQADGISTTTASTVVTRALAAQSDGVATTTSDLTVTAQPGGPVAVAGQSDGVSTATGTLSIARALVGQTDGVATVTGSLARARPFAGQADGVSTVTSVLGMARALTSRSDGVAADQAALTLALALAGRSDGVGATSAVLGIGKLLSGSSAGAGGGSGAIRLAVAFAGRSDGVETVTGAMIRALALAARSDGVGTVFGAFGGGALFARADGQASASGALSVTRPLAGQANGASTVTSLLTRGIFFIGRADGIGTTGAMLIRAVGLVAQSDGVTTVSAVLVVTRKGGISVWTGSEWREQVVTSSPILVWNGTDWKDDAQVWDGTKWQRFNPTGVG